MSTFIQAHLLVAYPAANLNRDDSGRPKTMIYGGAERLRISSQSLKRAIRTSDTFADYVGGHVACEEGHVGTRTKSVIDEMLRRVGDRMPKEEALDKIKAIFAQATKKEDDEEDADGAGKKTKKTEKNGNKVLFGTIKKEGETEEAVHLAPEELKEFYSVADRIAKGEKVDPKTITPFRERPRASDIAMFGRMLAGIPKFNVEAAAQVAHAFTTHRAVVEDDYFTAVDELKAERKEADKGAGFVGVAEFGTGLFYLYACVNASLLADNLRDDKELAGKTAAAFIEALAKTSPSGKQNSYASRSHATYGLVETGCQQPRSLAAAFLKPVGSSDDGDVFAASVARLEELRRAFERAYGAPCDEYKIMNVPGGKGSLAELVRLAADAAHNAAPLRKRLHAA